MIKYLTTIFILLLLSLMISECSKDKASIAQETDAGIFSKATSSGFTYYKGDSTIHRSSPQAAHASYFRVRFNSIALSALTDNGKLPPGGSFPTGSLVVKELWRDSTGATLAGYAIMEKLPNDTNQAAGWVWAEVGATGGGYMLSSKGDICTGCHGESGNRDYVRLFELFP